VIHTVGPVWTGGEHELLTRAYANSLTLAMSEGLRTIAFPSISTGAYRFPIQAASRTALATIRRNVETYPAAFDEIRIVLFNEPDYRVYREVLREHGGVS
jgi:O-acetyl-ADP-ribose deacetylase (regulator of RNase III)